MKRKYGKLTTTGVEYAQGYLRGDNGVILNPDDSDYLESGWKKVVDVMPAVSADESVEARGWKVEGDNLVRIYEVVNTGKKARKFSRYAMKMALASAGVLSIVQKALEEAEIAPGYSAWQAFNDAAYVREDYEGFERIRDDIVELIRQNGVDLSDEAVEEILNRSEWEDN